MVVSDEAHNILVVRKINDVTIVLPFLDLAAHDAANWIAGDPVEGRVFLLASELGNLQARYMLTEKDGRGCWRNKFKTLDGKSIHKSADGGAGDPVEGRVLLLASELGHLQRKTGFSETNGRHRSKNRFDLLITKTRNVTPVGKLET